MMLVTISIISKTPLSPGGPDICTLDKLRQREVRYQLVWKEAEVDTLTIVE